MFRGALTVLILLAFVGPPDNPVAGGGQVPIRRPGRIGGRDHPAGSPRPPRAGTDEEGISVTREECRQRLTVSADALFDPDEWEMTPEAEPLMSQLGRLLAKAGSNRVTIEAYTSSDRLPRYNRRLSEMRAQAVKNWLFEHQLVSTSTRIKGFALEPIGTTETSDLSEGIESRNKVEVVIQTCG